MEQLVARWAHNPKVTGSSPVPATKPDRNVWLFFVKFNLTFFRFMFTVYILYSLGHNKTYVGFTSDMEARFKAHNELGIKGWTIRYRPWVLIHTEKFDCKKEAMLREKELKSGKGRDFIKSLLRLKKFI